MRLSGFCLFVFGISFHTFFVYFHLYSFVFVFSPLFFLLFSFVYIVYAKQNPSAFCLLLFFLECSRLFCLVYTLFINYESDSPIHAFLSPSVPDPDPNPDPDPPDPHVFGPSGSGSFYHHAKLVRKP